MSSSSEKAIEVLNNYEPTIVRMRKCADQELGISAGEHYTGSLQEAWVVVNIMYSIARTLQYELERKEREKV